MRYMITDDLWDALEPLVEQAKRNRQGPAPKVPDRQFFEALLYLARTSIPWRDLPSEFGAWDAPEPCFRRRRSRPPWCSGLHGYGQEPGCSPTAPAQSFFLATRSSGMLVGA